MGQVVVLYDFVRNHICNVYMYRKDATPSLTSSTEIWDF